MKRQKIDESSMPTVTIRTHARPVVSNAETASEWENEESASHQHNGVAPAMARMGSSRMVVSSSIRRDGA